MGWSGAPAGNQNAAKGKENKGVIYPFDSDRKGSRSPERIIARLKRDAATDTHAAALLGSIEAPSASWCPQVPPGQASPHSPLAHDTQGLRRRLTGSRWQGLFGVFLPGKEKAPSLLTEAFVFSVQKILRLSSVSDWRQKTRFSVAVTLSGYMLASVLVYHHNRRFKPGKAFNDSAPAIRGLVVGKIIVVSLLSV